ncbi:TetR/AcrR family transcriptional regulator [Nocardia aobensis]|uniref:TetR/AcrR family transcriptional regulator n=1 Tax=Nocardia aobensis TaxID=257277 RepID=A0ABW6P9C8_9NOCA
MDPADRPPSEIAARTAYSATKLRTIEAALRLFAEHGISGTSLQMIADALGVTKAAIYYQFRTKDDIVLAVAESELAWLDEAVSVAESEPDAVRGRQVLLEQVIALAVRRRRLVGLLQTDPVMVRFLAEYKPFQRVIERLFAMLIGDTAAPDIRVKAAMMSAAIGGAAIHPLVTDLDDEVLYQYLLDIAHRLFQLPG